jgi:hypothetical protein
MQQKNPGDDLVIYASGDSFAVRLRPTILGAGETDKDAVLIRTARREDSGYSLSYAAVQEGRDGSLHLGEAAGL